MRLLNSKKGGIIELILDPLYNLIIATIVILLFWNSLMPGGTEKIESEFWTKDIALSATTISSTTGNLFVELINKPLGFTPINITFNFVKTGAVISTLNKKDITSRPFAFPYISQKDKNIEKAIIPVKGGGDKSQIKFTKINDNIFVDYKKTERNMNILECPQTEINKMNNVLVDPGQSNKNPGYIASNNPNFREVDITKSIALSLLPGLNGKTVELTRDITSNSDTRKGSLEISKLIDKSDLIISIHVGKNNDETLQFNKKYDFLKAYISSTSKNKGQSEALACKIANAISNLNPKMDGVGIIPIIPEQFPNDDPRNEMLNNNKIAVLLEIGNIENENGIITPDNLAKIGEAISDGIT